MTVCTGRRDVVPPRRVLCLGTLKVDIVTSLSGDSLTSGQDIYERRPVRFDIGGTAASIVRAAQGTRDWSVHVLAAIGDDLVAEAITSWLDANGAAASLQRCSQTPSAAVVIAEIDGTPRRRLLLSASESPHLKLTATHIKESASAFRDADLLIADCYALQGEESSRALDAALAVASEAGLFTVLDLAPHDLPTSVPLQGMLSRIRSADVVVAEARTLMAFFRGRWSAAPVTDRLLAREVVREFNSQFRGVSVVVRYGDHHIESCIYSDGSGAVVEYSTLYGRGGDTRGYGDALLLHELSSVINSG